MMISPESYYEEFLKKKSKEQIMTAIRGLKNEIGYLKNTMESPDIGLKVSMNPSEDVRLHCTREYLERAKQAYAEVGGTYILSKTEEKAANFDDNIDAIKKITFNIGRYFDGYRSYVIEITDRFEAYTKLWGDEEPLSLWGYNNEEIFTKDILINSLKELHIGEWRRRYSTKRFGYMVLDGTQWELVFEYNNGHKPIKFDGDNSYPYNFDKFQMLFGIASTEEDEDEQI